MTTPCASRTTAAYGLAGGVFSGSLERSLAVAHRMRAGVLSVNAGMPYSGRPSLRRLQGQRDRPTERHRRFRAVPRWPGWRAERRTAFGPMSEIVLTFLDMGSAGLASA